MSATGRRGRGPGCPDAAGRRPAPACPISHDPAVLEAGSTKARHLTESIATLRDQIACLERRRDELTAEHPDHAIFASFPGAGRATVPRLIVAFGTCRERYQSAFEVERSEERRV